MQWNNSYLLHCYCRVPTQYNMIKEYDLIFFSAIFISITNSTNIYHIVPGDGNDTSNNTLTLECYINNYNFTSNTELLFISGQHYLNTTMVVRDVQNITLIGMVIIRVAT